MKQEDIEIGKVYEVLVSGHLVPLLVKRSYEKSRYTFSPYSSPSENSRWKRFTYFLCENLRTKREISLRSSRLRRLHPDYNTSAEVVASEASLLRAQGNA